MSILIQPLITEKLTRIQEEQQKYAFKVLRSATKPQMHVDHILCLRAMDHVPIAIVLILIQSVKHCT